MKTGNLATALLLTMLVLAATAAAVQVSFQVRMAYQVELGNFDPATDFVDLAGTFNGWGSAPLTPLADADGDTIYEITLDGFDTSDLIEFKFRINGQWDGSEEFPGGGPNRSYVVQPGDNEILVWYSDLQPGGEPGGEIHWWNDSVFYEIFVRSFQDSDGDGIGDLQGLTQRLDHLDDLGITGIWLMPINDSPSYHGYDTTDYRSINPDYGTMADFEAFLAAAHGRGIKVIIDYVMNHCSTQHQWFVQSAQNNPTYRDHFRWSPSDPGQTGPWGQDVWHWNASGYYYGLFWGGMPDLNYDTPAVKTEMFDTATYWLEDVGVDGFRLDAVLYIHEDGDQLENTAATFQFWHDYNTHVKSVNPEAFSVGEAWTSTGTVLQYVTDQRLDICFEFELAGATLGAANDGNAEYLGFKAAQVHDLYPFLQFGTFLTNHDMDRSMTVLGDDQGKARVAAGIYLTLPGVPFVYYGEEIGMTGAGAHENIRTPMQWTGGAQAGFTSGVPWYPVNGDYPQVNVQAEDADAGSLLNWYRQLITVRNATPALRRGVHEALASSAVPVLGFVRQYESQTVLCLASTASQPLGGITLTGSASALEPGDHTLTNLLDPADVIEITVSPSYEISGLSLDAHEVAVYEFENATAVGDGALPVAGLRLEQNFPNPFNPLTTVRYSLPASVPVRLAIYDVAGREVNAVVDGVQAAGAHEVHWDGSDHGGRPLSAGVYFARLDAGGATRMVKMVLVK